MSLPVPPVDLRESSCGRRDFLIRSAALGIAGSATAATGSAWLRAAEQTDQAGWQLGCFTRPFAEFSYADTVAAIASAGYSAIGLMAARLPTGNVTLADANDSQVDEIRSIASQGGLAIAATYYGGPPVNRSFAAGVEAIERLIENCARSGCATILLGGTANEDLFDDYFRVIEQVCDQAAEKQVSLVLKPHGGLNATGPQCRKIVERVNHPAFRIWYDPGNIFYYSEGGLNPLDDVAEVAGLVTGMCVKDFRPPQDVALNPGEGQVDFPELFKRLAEGGFRSGPLIVETLAPGDLATTTTNASKTRQFLQSVLR